MNLSGLTKEQKQYIILGFLGIAVVLGLGWFGIRLSLNSVDKAKARLADLSDKIERADKTLARGGNTSADFESTADYLREELQRIPPDRNYYSWATEVIYSTARNSGLEIDSVDEYTQSGVKKSAAKAAQFESYSLRITAHGSYADTKNFLKVLEEDHPLVRIIGLDISSGGNPDSHDVQLLVQWPFRLDAVVKVWDQVEKTQTALAGKVSRPRLPIHPADTKPSSEPVPEIGKTEAPIVAAAPKQEPAKVKEPVVAKQKPQPVAPKATEPPHVVAVPKPEPVSSPKKPTPVKPVEAVKPEAPAVAETSIKNPVPVAVPEIGKQEVEPEEQVVPEVKKEAVAESPEPVVVPAVQKPEEAIVVAENNETAPGSIVLPEVVKEEPKEEPAVAVVEAEAASGPMADVKEPLSEPETTTLPVIGKSEPEEAAEEVAEIPESVEEMPEPIAEPVVVATVEPVPVPEVKEIEPETVEVPKVVAEPEVIAEVVVPEPEMVAAVVPETESFAVLETLPATEPEALSPDADVVMTEIDELSVEPVNDEPQNPEASELQSLLASLESRGDEPEEETPVEGDSSVAELEALAAQLAVQQGEAEVSPVPADKPVTEPEGLVAEKSAPESVVLKGEQYALTPNSAKILSDLLHVDKPKTADSLDSFLDGLMENIND